jgi:hypothetical protein
MTRYIIKKYVDADSLEDALRIERKVKPQDAFKAEEQPEQPTDQIGFDLQGSGYYYSPYLKRKKRKSKK